jgi:hypothetical protein
MQNTQQVAEKALETPGWDEIAVVIMISALAAYAVTWIVKSAVGHKANERKWWLRVIAVVSGALAGWAIGGWPWGIISGFGAGSLTTAIVGFIKSKMKGKADKLGD